MKLFERVLVAVAGDDTGTELIRYARAIRTVLGDVEFAFVHILGWPARSPAATPPITHAHALRRLEEDVSANFGDRRVRCLVLHGSVIDGILDCTDELAADLIVVGHNSIHGRRSVARRLAMQTRASVWMVPAGVTPSMHRVIAAIDYSLPAAYAVSIAAHLARRGGSRAFRVLHVYPNESTARGDENQPKDSAPERDAIFRFTAPIDTAALEIRPLLMECESVVGAVHELTECDPADVVVMGNRGRSRSASTLLGAECEHVLMESRIPVLIVKRKCERTGLLQALIDRNFQLPEPSHFR